jgi:hypothetical protein
VSGVVEVSVGVGALIGGAGSIAVWGLARVGGVRPSLWAAVIGGRWLRAAGPLVEVVAGAQAGSAARRLKAFAMAAAQGQSAGRCSVSRRAWHASLPATCSSR